MLTVIYSDWTQHASNVFRSLDMANVPYQPLLLKDHYSSEEIDSQLYPQLLPHHPTKRELMFYEVQVPKFWEVNTDGYVGYIWDKGIKKGMVHFSDAFKRTAHFVEWLNNKEQVVMREYYHPFGYRFKRELVNEQHETVMTIFFDEVQREMATQLMQGQLILNTGELGSYYSTWNELVLYKIGLQATQNQKVLVLDEVSLNQLLKTNGGGTEVFYWETKDRLSIYTQKNQRLQENSIPFSYLYSARQTFTPKVMIATNSEWIANLESIVKHLPEYEFYIVAVTEMGMNLWNLNQYDNVHLYPGCQYERFLQLLKECSVYLDINYGDEIFNAVTVAAQEGLLLLTFEETCHQEALIRRDNRYSYDDWTLMVNQLESFLTGNHFYDAIELQRQYLQGISAQEFYDFFNGEF